MNKSESRKWILMKWLFIIGTFVQLIAMLLNKAYPIEFFAFLGGSASVYFGANSACKFSNKQPLGE